MVLAGHADAVGRFGQGHLDGIPANANRLHEGKLPVLRVLDLPVTVTVVRHAHRVETAAQEGLFQILVAGGRRAQEVAADGDIHGIVHVMEVVVRKAEAVVTGAQSPVPVFVLRADPGVQFHELVTGECLQVAPGQAYRPVRMVDLDEVRAFPEAVQFKLHLGGEQRKERVVMDHPVAAEYQFVELERAVALLVHIDLQGGVERMPGDLVVIGEGDDVVPEAGVLRIRFVRPEFALVRREGALHAGMGVEIRPLPAIRRIQVPVRIEDVRSAEGLRLPEVINGADGGDEDSQKEQNPCGIDNLEQDATHPAQDMTFVCAALSHAILSGTNRRMRTHPNSFRRRPSSPSARRAFPALPAQKIAEIEEEMAKTQKNKATEGHLGLLKARIAKLRREQVESIMRSGGAKGEGFDVIKSGDARIGLIGFPSVGKSTLLNTLTDTFSEVQEREFTTLTCIPGVIRYRGSKLQLLDLPGIIEGAKDGKGKGRQVIGVARTCNLILVVLDAVKPLTHKRIIESELEGVGIRLNRNKPDIEIKVSHKGGGLMINRTVNSDVRMSDETITNIAKEYKLNNAEICFRGKCGVDDLIDAIEGNRVYIPALYVINKIDQITIEELDLLDQIPNYVLISAHLKWNLDELLEKIWDKLDLMRIYTKPKGQVPDYEEPVILLRKKRTVADFCNKIHRSLLRDLKYAIVWGSSVKIQPQKVGKDHVLNDEDVIQIVKKH